MRTKKIAPDRLVDGAFIIGFAAFAWLAVFGHRGVAPATGLMALAAIRRPDFRRAARTLLDQGRFSPDPTAIALIAMCGFSVWIAITAFWSPIAGAEWLGLTILASAIAAAALVFEGLYAAPKRARRLAALYAAAVGVAAAALMFEGLSGGYLRSIIPPTDESPLRWRDMTALGRGVTAVAPLVFPAAALLRALTGSWSVAFTPAIAAFVAAIQFSIFANVVAIAAGALVFAAALARPRLVLKIVGAAFLFALLVSPFVAGALRAESILEGGADAIDLSWAQRVIVWREAGALAIEQCFPLGCGADFARALSAQGETIEIGASGIALPQMPIHPHNLFIQIWLELGLPGVAAFGFAMFAVLWALLRVRLDSATSAAITAALSAAFISVMFEASLWQVWRLAVFALAAFGGAVSYSINNLKQ